MHPEEDSPSERLMLKEKYCPKKLTAKPCWQLNNEPARPHLPGNYFPLGKEYASR